jgi:hypothetical protein
VLRPRGLSSAMGAMAVKARSGGDPLLVKHHARVIGIVILLVALCLGVGLAGVATRGAWAEPAVDAAIRCALLHGRPALDAYDEAMRSRRPVAMRAEAAYNKGVELGELRRDEDAVAAYRAAIRVRPDYAAAYTNLGFALSRLESMAFRVLMPEAAVALAHKDEKARKKG